MLDYRSPVADILFALRAAAGADRLPGWDDDLARTVLDQAGRLVDEVVAPLDPLGDTHPARLEDGRVRLPPGFAAAYALYRDGGWPGLAVAEAEGGQGLPHVLAGAVSEMLSGACLSFQMLLSLGQGALRTLGANGSPAQKARWMGRLASGDWLATMCLTEPQAGSDLARIRCLARPDPAGGWRLSGGKVFISGGDQDLTGRALHLVLARTPDAPPGLRGLSLFLCPSELEDGRRNAVSVLRLEDKMGLHASPTCQMAFDEAWAELIGAPGEGLARMFTMMNAERLDVAAQGIGLAEIAGQRSRAYAAQRHQGRTGPGAGPDPIAAHPDIRRALLTQLALALGGRAMLYRVLVELELGTNPALVEIMTPICKAFCTDAGCEAADHAIQIHGGYGYLREYRVEQILRDARITRIYEGSNGIQGMTLVGRLLTLDDGACRRAFHAEIAAAAEGPAEWREDLTRAVAAWEAAASALLTAPEPGYQAADFLRLSGLLAFAAAWARLLACAAAAPSPARIRQGADFVRRWMLPECHLLAARCVGGFRPDPAGLEEALTP